MKYLKDICSVWYLMLAFVLWMLSKIFRANISTYVNFSWRLCSCLHDDVGIWWLGCKQCIFPAYFGWRKFGMAFGRRSSFSANVSWWAFSIFILLCNLIKPCWYWHSFSSLGCESVGLGVVGIYVRHQASHHLQFVDEHWPSMSNAF